MGRGGALALACALAFVADVEAKVGARRGGGYSIVNTGHGGDLDTATTVVILCFVGLAVIFCAFGALGARRLTRYRARYDASRALEELDLGTLTPGTKVTLRHNGVDIDGVGTVLGSSEPHGDRVQIEWPPSTPSHFTYRPDGPRGRKMRVERKTWWPRASVVPYTEPPEDTIECEAPARDPPKETTPTTHETLIDGKVMAGAWLCEWRDDDCRPEIFDRYKKNTAAAKVTSFGAMLALEADGDCEDGRVRLRSTPVNVDADQLIHSKLYAASPTARACTTLLHGERRQVRGGERRGGRSREPHHELTVTKEYRGLGKPRRTGLARALPPHALLFFGRCAHADTPRSFTASPRRSTSCKMSDAR